MKNAFETGKFYGNDLTIEVIKRTEKTITIKTSAWGETRVKVRQYNDETECIMFKAWYITANELFNIEEAKEIAFEKAYR